MNDVAIIAAALCCAAEDGGPRNGEAFNEIICAAPTALKFYRAPKSLIFTRLIRVMFSSRETEREKLLYECKLVKIEKSYEVKKNSKKKEQKMFHCSKSHKLYYRCRYKYTYKGIILLENFYKLIYVTYQAYVSCITNSIVY